VALRCLIVDDNAAFLDAAAALLEREGVTVVGIASASADALAQAQELRPDVVLADLIEEAPVAGFMPKSELSANAIRRVLQQ
jgi:CheY-like chemotaxis protein